MSGNIEFSNKILFSESSANSEPNKCDETLKNEANKYNKYKILLEGLEDLINKESLDANLRNKLRYIVLSENCARLINIKDNAKLLGIDFEPVKLNFMEAEKTKDALKLRLRKQYEKVNKEFESITGLSIVKIKAQAEISDQALIEYKKKLKKEQDLYIKNLLEMHALLEEIVHLRLQKLPVNIDMKIREYELGGKMNYLKYLVLHNKVRVDVFMETSDSLDAYKQLIKDLKEQQEDCQREMADLSELKEKYKNVSCKQFDDILKSYIQYENSIKKVNLMNGCITNT